MKTWHRMLVALAVATVTLAGAASGPAWASPPTPRTPDTPIRPPPVITTDRPAPEPPESPLALPPLKAVLVVGPIDGPGGSWTAQEKHNMDRAAAELEANGVTVHRFYTPNDDWAQIQAAAEDAHFFFYRGHGVYWSPLPHPNVGGFSLTARFVSPNEIRNELGLAPNAIVMLYGCFTAGSSGIEGDDIDSAEAQRRVAQYSDPFFDVGAGGYYANWSGDAFQMFVRYLFQGKTLGEAYESYSDFDNATVERYTHPDHPTLAMWLDKDVWGGKPRYNNAFAGHPYKTLLDLFEPAEMTLSLPSITYLAEPSFAPRPFVVRIASTKPGADFNWTATVTPADAAWLAVEPQGGRCGQDMQVEIRPGGQSLGTYQASIRVVADDPQVQNRDQTIPVTLHVVERVYLNYLPVVQRLMGTPVASRSTLERDGGLDLSASRHTMK